MVKWPWTKRQAMEATHARGYHVAESEKGAISTSYQWTERQPHPEHMSRYEEWSNDAEASVALEVLTNIIAGVGYYTEMPEEYREDDTVHPHQQLVDDYGEAVNLDEKAQTIVHSMLGKGFCPVEILGTYDLKILPSESFFIHQDRKGKLLKYTQERSVGDVVAEWKTPAELATIVPFFFGWTPTRPYGKSLLDPIGPLLDSRAQMNVDMPKAVHRWAYPIPIMETSGSKDTLQQACEDRDIDDWIFIGNVNDGEVRWNTLEIDPQARFIPYIELIYYQICEGLHAPLLLYLKNATEASATVMMESVDRLVNGVQRYVKRRIEHYLFKPQTGDPVPRLMWGKPTTGLEEFTAQDVASIINSPKVANNQVQWLLKQFFSGLPAPDWPADASIMKLKSPFDVEQPGGLKPFQRKPPEVSAEALIERLNDLQTSLDIIEQNHQSGRLSVTEACRLADRTISVHMQRAYPDDWERRRDERFQRFLHEKLAPKLAGKTYTVAVDD